MKAWMVSCGLVVLFSWQNIGLADDGSARRYLVALESSLEAEFFLLLRSDVRNYLAIAGPEYVEIAKIMLTDFKSDLPLNKEWEYWQQTDARKKMSKEELAKKSDEMMGKIEQAIYALRMKALAGVLSKDQLETLRNLMFQYRGPWHVVTNPQWKADFKLTDAQVQKLTSDLQQLLRRIEDRSLLYLGRESSPFDLGETGPERSNELESIHKEISALKKQRDDAVLEAFDAQQKEKWKAACGKPVALQWDPKLLRYRTADAYLRAAFPNGVTP